ncbi:MAG TPA: hypothetical protein VGF76_00980 [Polyangiaceae bacterium]|jgi:hypothetical protein|nr:hypothetical protein [Polyangiaceae bacterium]
MWHAVIATLAVLTFFGDVYHTAHLLLTPHVRCPFDGALVHEDELPLSARNQTDLGRAQLPVSAVPRHEHGDCAARSAVHRFATIMLPVRRAVRCAEALGLVANGDGDGAVARSVLSYAPKLSPPA